MLARLLLCLVVLVLWPACHRQTHDKPAPPAARKGQKRAPETMLYVDGVPRASISAGELLRSGRLPLCELLSDAGVACSSIRALHLHGADGSVTPLANVALARIEVDAGSAPRVDGKEVSALTVYVARPPPSLPVQGIAYLDEPVRGGTRVNVDGRLAARLKRNRIEGNLPEAAGGYALADFLALEKLSAPRAVELITADDEVVRVPDAEVGRVRFGAEPEKHGQRHREMSFRFGGRAVSAVAVNLYVAVAPPVRQRVPALATVGTRQAGFSAGCSVVW